MTLPRSDGPIGLPHEQSKTYWRGDGVWQTPARPVDDSWIAPLIIGLGVGLVLYAIVNLTW